jgi:hypothetical protein
MWWWCARQALLVKLMFLLVLRVDALEVGAKGLCPPCRQTWCCGQIFGPSAKVSALLDLLGYDLARHGGL